MMLVSKPSDVPNFAAAFTLGLKVQLERLSFVARVTILEGADAWSIICFVRSQDATVNEKVFATADNALDIILYKTASIRAASRRIVPETTFNLRVQSLGGA